MRLMLFGLIALGVFSAMAQKPGPEVPAPASGGVFDRVRQGLAHEMQLSARQLEAGRRHDSMKALDRALHLSEFGRAAFDLPDKASQPFEEANRAIRDARHVLQMGRPEEAVRILKDAGAVLERAIISEVPSPGLTRERAAGVQGNYVLNARGHRLGELKAFSVAEDGTTLAVIGSGGLLSLGETLVEVSLEALLGSDSFIVLPVTISQKEFAAKTRW